MTCKMSDVPTALHATSALINCLMIWLNQAYKGKHTVDDRFTVSFLWLVCYLVQ